MLKPLRPSVAVVACTPGYRCYCCHDTGLIIRQDAFLTDFIPSDVGLMCRRCSAASTQFGDMTKHLDGRVAREQCEALHNLRYQDWLDTVREMSAGMKSAAPEDNAVAVYAEVQKLVKPIPALPEPDPAPEKPITEYDGYRIGDRVRITIARFSQSEQKEIISNREVTVGETGLIIGFEKSRISGEIVAVVQFGEMQRRLGSVWFESDHDGEVVA